MDLVDEVALHFYKVLELLILELELLNLGYELFVVKLGKRKIFLHVLLQSVHFRQVQLESLDLLPLSGQHVFDGRPLRRRFIDSVALLVSFLLSLL